MEESTRQNGVRKRAPNAYAFSNSVCPILLLIDSKDASDAGKKSDGLSVLSRNESRADQRRRAKFSFQRLQDSKRSNAPAAPHANNAAAETYPVRLITSSRRSSSPGGKQKTPRPESRVYLKSIRM